MIINSGGPLSPKVSFTINNVEVNYFSINQVFLELDVNKHDVLTIIMNGIPPKAVTDYVGAAVEFSLSSGPGRNQVFKGYVLYVEPEYSVGAPVANSSVLHTAKIVCFGASLVMKGAKQRVWDSVNIYKLAQEMASKYNFSLECIKDDYQIPRIAQPTESDWEFMVRVCETYGYSMTVHGTHMAIWDPFKAIGHRRSYERLVPVNAYLGASPGAIVKMHGTFGELTPDGESYKYHIASFDSTGAVINTFDKYNSSQNSWSGMATEPKYTSTVSESAVSVGEAEKMIGAIKRRNFPFNVSLTVSAGAGIVPGGVVEITGYKSNFEGLWYVKSVCHTITGSSYNTELQVSKDYNTTNQFVVPPTELSIDPPESVLIGDTWRAKQNRVTLYV